jgi:hypothetical protein
MNSTGSRLLGEDALDHVIDLVAPLLLVAQRPLKRDRGAHRAVSGLQNLLVAQNLTHYRSCPSAIFLSTSHISSVRV